MLMEQSCTYLTLCKLQLSVWYSIFMERFHRTQNKNRIFSLSAKSYPLSYDKMNLKSFPQRKRLIQSIMYYIINHLKYNALSIYDLSKGNSFNKSTQCVVVFLKLSVKKISILNKVI